MDVCGGIGAGNGGNPHITLCGLAGQRDPSVPRPSGFLRAHNVEG